MDCLWINIFNERRINNGKRRIYFSDLPISSDINEFMFESISSCINFKKQLKELENEIYNLKFVIPFITKETYKKKALDKAGAYLTKYNFIDGMSFQDIYKMFYIIYIYLSSL